MRLIEVPHITNGLLLHKSIISDKNEFQNFKSLTEMLSTTQKTQIRFLSDFCLLTNKSVAVILN